MIKSVVNPKKNIFMSLFEIFIFILFNYLLKYIKLIESKIEKSKININLKLKPSFSFKQKHTKSR